MDTVKLFPECKDNLWGGVKLVEKYGKKTDKRPCAESWDISFHENGLTRLENGKTLKESVTAAELGKNAAAFDRFPMLVKFIDAAQDLSVQVHPTDEIALRDYGSYGKTEMWYIVEAEEGAGIYLGFAKDVTKEECEQAIANNTLSEKIRFYPVQKGQHYFVPSGTVHAIGAGCLIMEIQQNSDLTYRIYDYGRRDKNGNLRELHVEKALETSRLTAREKIEFCYPCAEGERLGVSRYFTLNRCKIDGKKVFKTDEGSFRAVTCTEGEGFIDGQKMQRGDTFFVAATRGEFIAEGSAELLISEVRSYGLELSFASEGYLLTLCDDLGERFTQLFVPNVDRLKDGYDEMLQKTGLTKYDVSFVRAEKGVDSLAIESLEKITGSSVASC